MDAPTLGQYGLPLLGTLAMEYLDYMCVLTGQSFFPLGRVIVVGFSVTLLFTTGAPLTRKWPVVPESEMAYFTALVTFDLSKMVAAIGSCCKLFACTSVFHAFGLTGMEI